MYEFLKAAFTKQTNIRFKSRLRADILMHERIEHEINTELYGVLISALQGYNKSLHNPLK